jgi:hypothetical protein
MKVEKLISMLLDLPSGTEVYVDNNGETFHEMILERITESHDDPTIIGYLLTDKTRLDEDKVIVN